ncbi:hypothetical protein EDL79_01585 [Ehrlichia ruminantium]|uniref:Uncharacterized protein n=1 Tax=Ehrlichia ruminantium TaxID=779 RepID=A0AAE6QA10_EHRRU|nr:hypothetical protein [Ehrlichia ruminantium]QGR03285.1 hypothetical protein EDL80_01585 [Ehrlichia ruminantium]QGR04211.1 hypothetical protein EDL79_01585 [Ehrlichia ruminantium]
MFYTERDIKSIYSSAGSPSIEYILSLMNQSNDHLMQRQEELKNQFTEHQKAKLAERGKSNEEIQQYLSHPNFSRDIELHSQQMLKNEIVNTLHNDAHIGDKVKILTRCIRKLPENKKLLILKGIYRLAFLNEMNQTMQDMSDQDFEAFVKVVIVCSHLKSDTTALQKQAKLEEAIAAHKHATSSGCSLEDVARELEKATGIDINNPLSSIKKKLNFGKKTEAKQHLESLDEILISSSVSPILTCSFFLLTALTLSMPGLGGALLPVFTIGVVGKSVYGIITHDKYKEGTIHCPFPESMTYQPLTPEGSKNYTAMLEEQKSRQTSTKHPQDTSSKQK